MSDFSEKMKSASQGDLFASTLELPEIDPDIWQKLARSAFRQQFHLNASDRAYLARKGLSTVLEHGADFIAKRLAPAHPEKDGRQTPWKGHPVFVAQHATGTCCRSCLEKWHHFTKGFRLTVQQQHYVLAVIGAWLEREETRPVPTEENTPIRVYKRKSRPKL